MQHNTNPTEKGCCPKCRSVNAGINTCIGDCACHTPAGEAIKENLRLMNNRPVYDPTKENDLDPEDIKGGTCSKCGTWKGGEYGMNGEGVQSRHVCPTKESGGWEGPEGSHYFYRCSDDVHNSFWKTVVESPEWAEWEKVAHEAGYDYDECRDCGWISPAHFRAFLANAEKQAREEGMNAALHPLRFSPPLTQKEIEESAQMHMAFEIGRQRGADEMAKAFGGCKKCYGKGYSTHMQQLVGSEDFGGDGFVEKPKVHITYCTCDRGIQLKKLFISGADEMVEKCIAAVPKKKDDYTHVCGIHGVDEHCNCWEGNASHNACREAILTSLRSLQSKE